MQLKNRIFAAILVLLLTGANLAMLKLIDILDETKPTLHVPIPENVNWKLRVNLKTIVKKELYTVFFEEDDREILNQIRTQVQERLESQNKKPSIYLNLEDDIVLYSIDVNHANFFAYLLQTKNSEKFNQNVPAYLNRNQAAVALGSNALFITQKSGKHLTPEQLKTLAYKWIHATQETFNYPAERKDEILEIAVNNMHNTVRFKNLYLRMSQQKQAFNFEGNIIYPEPIRESMPFTLKSKGVFLYSRFIPKQIPDTLINFLPKGLPHFKNISSFAIDYQGMSLEEPMDSLPHFVGQMLIPKMNLIIRAGEPVKIEDLWKEFPNNVQKPNLTLLFGNTTYYMKQLDNTTYFIGIDPSSVVPFKGDDLFILNGDLRKSTKVYGGTFITAIIENMGPMKALNEFWNSTNKFNVSVQKSKNTTYKINGKIDFKDDHFPLHELAKLLLHSPIEGSLVP